MALLGAEVTLESACKFGHILHILRILFVMQIGDLCGIQVMANVRPSSKLRLGILLWMITSPKLRLGILLRLKEI